MGSQKKKDRDALTRREFKKIYRKKLHKQVAKILSNYEQDAMEVRKDISLNPDVISDSSSCSSAPATGKRSFARMRKSKFDKLLCTVSENWHSLSSVKLAFCTVETITLQIEQLVLIAALQSEIYRTVMRQVITDIQRATSEKRIHKQVFGIIQRCWPQHLAEAVKSEPVSSPTQNKESSVLIPLVPKPIDLTRDCIMLPAFDANEAPPASTSTIQAKPYGTRMPQTPLPSDVVRSINAHTECTFSELNLLTQHHKPENIRSNVPASHLLSSTSPSPNFSTTPVLSSRVLEKQPRKKTSNTIASSGINSCMKSSETSVDDICEPDNSIEIERRPLTVKSQDSSSDLNIEELMHILEGTDDTAPNLNRQVENLFRNKATPIDASKLLNSDKPIQYDLKLQSKMWYLERYIFSYKMATRSNRLERTLYLDVRQRFRELFGDDSDDENDDKHVDHEKFMRYCVRRVLPLVAKLVLHYYNNKRIIGTNVYKSLVRRIARNLVDENDYPSERFVYQYVKRYFVGFQCYSCLDDVASFVPQIVVY